MRRKPLVSIALLPTIAILVACSVPDQGLPANAASTTATTVEVVTTSPQPETPAATASTSSTATAVVPAAVASASSAPSLASRRQQQLNDELAKLNAQALDALSTPGLETKDVLRGSSANLDLLQNQAAQGGGGGARTGTGEASGKSSASINGKAPKDATETDVEKAIRDAGCTPKPVPNKSPLAVFEVACGDRAYELTFAPPGAKLAAGQRDTLTKDAAVFEEGGILLVVRPSTGTDLERARVLLRKLWGDAKAGQPVGSLAVGGASVSGGAVSNASAVVAGMAAGFRRCYNRALQEDGEMKGTLRLSLVLGPNGEVQTSTATDVSPALSATLVGCVKSRGASAQFAAPDGGAATVTVPLTFTSTTTIP